MSEHLIVNLVPLIVAFYVAGYAGTYKFIKLAATYKNPYCDWHEDDRFACAAFSIVWPISAVIASIVLVLKALLLEEN